MAMTIERQTHLGRIIGIDRSQVDGTYAWLGIPFTRPAVGQLRWRAPVEPEPWNGVLEARAFGPACVQTGRLYGPGLNNAFDRTIATAIGRTVGEEGHLSLNIWRPASDAGDLPVLFFVHGGSNVSGYAADPLYDGAALARRIGAVVVTTNYRLGPFGFLRLPHIAVDAGPDEASGNFALLDISAALTFVRRNIGEFGGDAGNVTLMGHSAGAINAWALFASPKAAGLFHKLVALSGGISLATELPPGTFPLLSPAQAHEALATNLLHHLLMADGTAADIDAARAFVAARDAASVAAYLRSKDASTVLDVALAKGLWGWGPIPDGSLLAQNPVAEFAAGRYTRMPVLAGLTRDEGKLFATFLPLFGRPSASPISEAERFALLHDFDPDTPGTLSEADVLAPDYLPVDAPGTGWNAIGAMLTEVLFARSRDSVLNALKTQQDEIWSYRFDWEQEPPPWRTAYGAAHVFDLPFLFGNFGPSLFARAIGGRSNAEGRRALSDAMLGALGAFVRHGDPNHAGLGTPWRRWPEQLVFDASETQTRIW